MALTKVSNDRRAERRLSAGEQHWRAEAVLRPGQPVVVVNVTSLAALVESGTQLRPGAQTELQLTGGGRRVSVRGQLDRCHVIALEPLRYRGVLVFDRRLVIETDGGHERE